MKLIFLDFDGVINGDSYFNSDSFKKKLSRLNLEDAPLQKIGNKAPHLLIDSAAIVLLNQLVDQSGAQVVLSSSWRGIFPLEQINRMLKKRGAKFQLIATTPMKFSYRYRGYDIKEYLDNLKEYNSVTPEAFVILDDIDEFSNYQKNFVQTSDKTGLTIENVSQALKILDCK